MPYNVPGNADQVSQKIKDEWNKEINRQFDRQFSRPGLPLGVGLNFVSFQDNPERLFGMLKTPGWLGDANFGGAVELLPGGRLSLLTVEAAGVFVCPPVVDGEAFPGQGIFHDSGAIA